MSNSKQIMIDILSDVVCPWCVIGYYRIQVAIKDLGIEDQVSIRWHPFELNPSMAEEGENLREHLAAKYGTTINGSIEARKRLTALGQEVGFQFNYFDDMRMFNTRKVHLLLRWAEEKGKQTQLAESFFRAYFSDQKDISNKEVLLQIVAISGLDKSEAEDVLGNASFQAELVEIERKWLSGGFHGVPVVIINSEEVLQGAQETETYRKALTTAS
ncbi:MAG: DsbA family oxidoreductase [Saccharospirillaceae bacterium]|nr:DsbA family oxidoreductase [Saccharospirillaceae bacterium]